MKVEHFPNGPINPMALLARRMEEKPEKVIVLSCVGGEWSITWSTMQNSDLIYALFLTDIEVSKHIAGKATEIIG